VLGAFALNKIRLRFKPSHCGFCLIRVINEEIDLLYVTLTRGAREFDEGDLYT
jgi:hypothetical protein